MKRLLKLNRLLVLLALLVLGMTWRIPEAAADHCSRGEGTLSGPAINGKVPSGKVKWQGNAFCQPLEFQVEVQNINLPDGTGLSVDACARGFLPTSLAASACGAVPEGFSSASWTMTPVTTMFPFVT
jgi:hypothetical protein